MQFATSSPDPHVQNLTDQLNAKSALFGIQPGDKLPGGASAGSMAVYQTDTTINLHLADTKGQFGNAISFPKSLQYFTGVTRTTAPPSTTEIPTSGGFGWHLNTSTGAYYIALNDAGSIVYPNFLGISGIITTTQHSNLSGVVTTLHDFTQISGAITGTQHGDLSGSSSTFHQFASISGTISAAQHAAQTSGTLHAAVVAGGASGFMIGTDKTKLNNYPADCTTVYNDSNAVQRSGGDINATRYLVNGTLCVGAPQTGYTNATGVTLLRNASGTATTTTGGVTSPDFTAANFQILARFVYTMAFDLGVGGSRHNLITA